MHWLVMGWAALWDVDAAFRRYFFMAMASFAGAVSSLGFTSTSSLSNKERAYAIFVSMSFSLIVVPVVGSRFLRIPQGDLQTACAVVYFGAIGAHIFIPKMIRRFAREIDSKDTPL